MLHYLLFLRQRHTHTEANTRHDDDTVTSRMDLKLVVLEVVACFPAGPPLMPFSYGAVASEYCSKRVCAWYLEKKNEKKLLFLV